MPAASAATTVVTLGRFEPDRFRIEELEKAKVISGNEAAKAKVLGLLPGKVTHFTLPWGELLALQDRFQVSVSEAPFVRAADLIAQSAVVMEGRFFIRAFGINCEAHFDLGSLRQRDAFAMRFAPPDAWSEWGNTVRASMEHDDPERHGGLTVLTYREPFRSGDIRGWFDVTLTPSEKIQSSGVQFLTNHHHEFVPKSPPEAGPEELRKMRNSALLSALSSGFDASVSKAETIFAEVNR